MKSLSISVVIPTYNRAALITRALTSAITSTVDGDEIIVIDDGSCDDTENVLSYYSDRIRYVKTHNMGAGHARNVGIKLASNDLIAFLDSDDEWLPYKLNLQRHVMSRFKDVLLCFTDFMVIDKDGNTHNNFLIKWHNDQRSWNEILGLAIHVSDNSNKNFNQNDTHYRDCSIHIGNIYSNQAFSSYIFTSTTVVRRCELTDNIFFPEDIPLYEDWEYFSIVAQKGLVSYINLETAINHGHPSPRLTDADLLIKTETRIKLLKRIWGSNRDFLNEFGDRYNQVLQEQYLTLLKCCLYMGDKKKSKKIKQDLYTYPLHIGILSSLPGWMTKFSLALYAKVKSAISQIMGSS
jgi:glycosyltransferase involved in cell wall biosynthesis